MFNKCIFAGRLTRDPELRNTPNGSPTCSFTLAVDRGFKNKDGEKECDFINIVAWGKLAENAAAYLEKGKLALAEGRLQIRSYENKDGLKVYVTEIIANDIKFLSPKENTQTQEQLNQPNLMGTSDEDTPW